MITTSSNVNNNNYENEIDSLYINNNYVYMFIIISSNCVSLTTENMFIY